MFCSRCGKPLEAGSSFCTTCNAPAVGMAAPPPWAGRAPAAAVTAAAAAPEYAGFWLRVVAYFIDYFVVMFAAGTAIAVVSVASGGKGRAVAFLPFLTLVGHWLYFALLESSARQATLGKMALGLTVTGDDGRRIGFGCATGRFFGKIVSAIPIGIGFLLAGFTARKQALHDIMAGTLVTRKAGKSSTATVVVAVAAGGLVLVAVIGMLAAIAIPNFLRYQLRSKAAEAKTNLVALAKAELSARQRTGRFGVLSVPTYGTPGTQKMTWSAEDLAAAQGIDWPVEGTSYFKYRVAVEGEAFAICAESDIDGDGQYAAYALWKPDAMGAAPAAPCPHAKALERSLEYSGGDPAGAPVQLTADNVF
jgi:uncharacterized RDD family membrane protein YckC/type II secretory pathway pseudopilin PulG